MIDEYVMIEHNCTGKEVISDAIGMAAYTMDSHNVQRIVVNGMVKNEGDVEIGGFPPYPISYRSLTPKRGECKNLLVPVCLSATHIACGSIRMGLVFMVLAQSSAIEAPEAINTNKSVQEVDVKKIQAKLIEDPLLNGSIPDIIDDMDSTYIQKAGTFEKSSAWMGQYGATYLVSTNADDKTIVTLVHDIKKTAQYDAYFYCPSNTKSGKIKIQVKVKEKTFSMNLDPAQYHGEFASIETYSFEKGQMPAISAMLANSNGILVVDALLLKAKKSKVTIQPNLGNANINDFPADIELSATQLLAPAPGIRVRSIEKGWEEPEVYHTLHLPKNWNTNKKFPVIIEYAGNGDYNECGDVCDGSAEGSVMGYGLSGGRKFIWLCLPFVEKTASTKKNAVTWWRDVDETIRYCQQAVADVCSNWGGDTHRVILMGFSRGAIACNYIGLHGDDIAHLWCGMLCYSHYEGEFKHTSADLKDWPTRLQRLGDRPQFICQEISTLNIEQAIQSTGYKGNFTYVTIPFKNHSQRWTLCDLPVRKQARKWIEDLVR